MPSCSAPRLLVEFFATCTRRKLLGASQALALVRLSRHRSADAGELLVRGLELHQEHSLSLWAGLIVQAALDAKCHVRFSEDLQHDRRFGGLKVVNPFVAAAHEPRAVYKRSRTKKQALIARE